MPNQLTQQQLLDIVDIIGGLYGQEERELEQEGQEERGQEQEEQKEKKQEDDVQLTEREKEIVKKKKVVKLIF